jgi:hypothetical protein
MPQPNEQQTHTSPKTINSTLKIANTAAQNLRNLYHQATSASSRKATTSKESINAHTLVNEENKQSCKTPLSHLHQALMQGGQPQMSMQAISNQPENNNIMMTNVPNPNHNPNGIQTSTMNTPAIFRQLDNPIPVIETIQVNEQQKQTPLSHVGQSMIPAEVAGWQPQVSMQAIGYQPQNLMQTSTMNLQDASQMLPQNVYQQYLVTPYVISNMLQENPGVINYNQMYSSPLCYIPQTPPSDPNRPHSNQSNKQ